jgi:very-short-patch-repair endonuclease
MSAINITPITIVKDEQLPDIFILKIGTELFYRITDISLFLGYKNSISIIKLKDDYKCNLKTLMELITNNDIKQQNIIKESKDITMTRLTLNSQFTDFNGLKIIISRCRRKHAALNAERNLNLQASNNKCIQAKIEYLLIPYLHHWNIMYEHEKTITIASTRYRIDIVLPLFRIAIEIDEHGHADRDKIHENNRQSQLEQIGYYFVRLNPHHNQRKPLELIVAEFWRKDLWPVLRNRNFNSLNTRRLQLKNDEKAILNIKHEDNIMQVQIVCICKIVMYYYLQLYIFIINYHISKN